MLLGTNVVITSSPGVMVRAFSHVVLSCAAAVGMIIISKQTTINRCLKIFLYPLELRQCWMIVIDGGPCLRLVVEPKGRDGALAV